MQPARRRSCGSPSGGRRTHKDASLLGPDFSNGEIYGNGAWSFGPHNNRCEDLSQRRCEYALLLQRFSASAFLFFVPSISNGAADLADVPVRSTTWNVPLITFTLPGSQNAYRDFATTDRAHAFWPVSTDPRQIIQGGDSSFPAEGCANRRHQNSRSGTSA